MKIAFRRPGMRIMKTMTAVAVCFLIFLPFWQGGHPAGVESATQISPFYACVAAVICMQNSAEQSLRHGVSRLIGTGVGGSVSLLILWLAGEDSHPLLFGALISLGVMLTIWLCTMLGRPAACSIGAVVCCAVLLSHSGPERYYYTLIRIGATAVGVLVAVVINYILPDYRDREEEKK